MRPVRGIIPKCIAMDRCNVCGEDGGKMRTYFKVKAEPQPGWGLYVSGEHGMSVAKVGSLGYTRHVGFPAHFPQVCAGCQHRAKEPGRVETCANPKRGELRAIRSRDDKMDVAGCTGRAA
jgi:hypothetical protein